MLKADKGITLLGLVRHPEGGWYRETFRDVREIEGRAASIAIYLLDAVETWHWHAGAPRVITISPDGHDAAAHHLGPELVGNFSFLGFATLWFGLG